MERIQHNLEMWKKEHSEKALEEIRRALGYAAYICRVQKEETFRTPAGEFWRGLETFFKKSIKSESRFDIEDAAIAASSMWNLIQSEITIAEIQTKICEALS